MEDNNKAPTSWYGNGVYSSKQADEEPNFIGDAWYYDLHEQQVLDDIGGLYLIMHTRQVGEGDAKHNRTRNFEPHLSNTITLKSNKDFNSNSAYLAEGVMKIHGILSTFGCGGVTELPAGQFVTRTCANFGQPELMSMTLADDPIFRLFATDIMMQGSNISFGVKPGGQVWDEEDGECYYSGFKFLELELPCIDHARKITRQRLIAVKVPSNGRVSSASVLKQTLHGIDATVVANDAEEGELASWQKYHIMGKLKGVEVDFDWEPDFLELLGIFPMHFDAGNLEFFLLTDRNDHRALENIRHFLDRMDSEDLFVDEQVFTMAKGYVESRLAGLVNEKSIRQQGQEQAEAGRQLEKTSKDDFLREVGIAPNGDRIQSRRRARSPDPKTFFTYGTRRGRPGADSTAEVGHDKEEN